MGIEEMMQRVDEARHDEHGGSITLLDLMVAAWRDLSSKLDNIARMERKTMSNIEDVKGDVAAINTKIDTVGTKVDALEQALKDAGVASDAAVSAALDDVRTSLSDVGTHVDAVSSKFDAAPVSPDAPTSFGR